MESADQGQYDKKKLFRLLVILGLITILGHFTRGYVFCVLPFFIFLSIAQRKAVDLLFWVLLLTFFAIGNRFFYPMNTVSIIAERGTLIAITVILMMRAAGRRAPKFIHPMLGIFLYIGWEAISSMQGYAPSISYMKLILFVPMYLSVYAIACDVTASTRTNAKLVRTVVLAILILIIGGSDVLMFIPGIGQMGVVNQVLRGGDVAGAMRRLEEGVSLFCGMAAHSQALGPLIAILSSLIFADYVFTVRRKDWIYLGLLFSCPVLVYKTSSRTAMGAYIAGIGMVAFLFMQARAVGQRWKGKVMMTLFAFGVLSIVAGLALPSVRTRALGFVLKTAGSERTAADLTMENVSSSRQSLIDEALAGFREKPLLGNGYQVSVDMKGASGLYLSAPIEKGVWPTAVLEEGGAVGLVLFAGFLLLAIVLMIKHHAYCGACVLWTMTVANLGEFSFFSMSYVGGFNWTLVFTGLILDGQRIRTVGLEAWDVPIEVVMEEVGMPEWQRRRG